MNDDQIRDSRFVAVSEKRMIYRRDSGRCRYCGNRVRFDEAEFDHVYPHSLGGMTAPDNLVVSCQKCNRSKSDAVGVWPAPLDYWILRRAAAARLIPAAAILAGIAGLWITTAGILIPGTPAAIPIAGVILTAGAIVFEYGYHEGNS